jgi:two-component system OmpR family response regulator
LRILVVEDEEVLAQALVEILERESYAVDHAPDGETAEELAAVNEYDLVVLDWTIPPPTGIELLRAWRREGRGMPVLMLTARAAVDDRVDGLDTGADDFLAKPFSLAELLARVRSLLRRREKPLQAALTAGDLTMDRAGRRVTVDDRDVELSPKELALLEYFLLHKDVVISRTELSEHVWDDSFDSLANVIDVTVHRLRSRSSAGATRTAAACCWARCWPPGSPSSPWPPSACGAASGAAARPRRPCAAARPSSSRRRRWRPWDGSREASSTTSTTTSTPSPASASW